MSLKNILSNEALHGKLYDNLNFFSEPIIDKPTFDKIQLMLANGKSNKGRHSYEFINIFRGLAKCKHCGEAYCCYSDLINRRTGKAHKNPYRYMRCSGVANGSKCKNKHAMNLKDIEDEFFAVFLKKDASALFQDKPSDNEAELTAIDNQLKAVSSSITKILKFGLDLPEAEDEINELKSQKEKLLTKKQTLANQNIQSSVNVEMAINFQKLYDDLWNDGESAGFDTAIDALREKLKNPELRLKLRLMLPSIISKIAFNGIKNEWQVFDLTGNLVYTAMDNK